MDPYLPIEIICCEILLHVNFRTKLAVGRTCKALSLIWKTSVWQLPPTIARIATTKQFQSFTSVRRIADAWSIDAWSIKIGNSIELYQNLEELMVRDYIYGTYVPPKLTSLTIMGVKGMNMFENVAHLTGLTRLNIAAARSLNLKDDDVRALVGLRELLLSQHNLSSDAFKDLTLLESLRLGMPSKTMHGSTFLRNLTRLKTLIASSGSIKLVDDDLLTLPNLTTLHMGLKHGIKGHCFNTKLTTLGFINGQNHWISHLTLLEDLQIGNSLGIDDIGIANLTRLKYLCVQDCNITNAGIVRLQNLTELHLEGCSPITGSVLSRLPNLTNLKIMNNAAVYDDDIMYLTQLRTLIINNGITDIGIADLTGLTDLTANTNITDEGLMKLTNLTCLYVKQGGITDAGISRLVSLERLYLSNWTKVSVDGLKPLTKLIRLVPRDGKFKEYAKDVNNRIPFDPSY
jgi:hypothetical protein